MPKVESTSKASRTERAGAQKKGLMGSDVKEEGGKATSDTTAIDTNKTERKAPQSFTTEEDLILLDYFKKRRNFKEMTSLLPHRHPTNVKRRSEKLLGDLEKAIKRK